MSTIGIGLIGCGGRLRGVMKQLARATDRVEVRAVMDPSPDSVRAAREAFNANATAYEDYHDLVRDPQVDWVLIGSWNCFHAAQAVAAFEAGKHVFCEKPLATTLDDCLAMRDAWLRSGKLFSIGFTLRYSPHYRRVKELLAEGRVGRIVSMEFNETLDFNHGGYIHMDWRRRTANAGTHLLEKCCHDLDLTNWMVESLARRVASFGGTDFFLPENAHHIDRVGPNEKGQTAYKTWRSAAGSVDSPFTDDKDIIDNQVGIIEFASGVRTTFHTNCNTAVPERRMYICGTEGTLRADVIAGTIELRRIGFDTETEDCSTDAKGGHGGGDNILGESLAASMLRGEAPKASLEDGLKSAITAFGMDEAMATGRVVDMRPYWERAGIEFVPAAARA